MTRTFIIPQILTWWFLTAIDRGMLGRPWKKFGKPFKKTSNLKPVIMKVWMFLPPWWDSNLQRGSLQLHSATWAECPQCWTAACTARQSKVWLWLQAWAACGQKGQYFFAKEREFVFSVLKFLTELLEQGMDIRSSASFWWGFSLLL